jgi:hypothetical protein
MARRVSLWIVVALVGALAATTAAVIVLSGGDEGATPASVAGPQPGAGWPRGVYGDQEGSDPVMPSGAQGGAPMQIVGDMPGHRNDGHDASILPWLFFAITTGTAVGLLIAWSPWHTAAAGATGNGGGAGPSAGFGPESTSVRIASSSPTLATAPANDIVAAGTTDATTPVVGTMKDVAGETDDAASEPGGSAAEVTEETVANEAQTTTYMEDAKPSDF